MLKISIIEGHHVAQSRMTKNGARHYQDAYVDLGGAFPQHIQIPLGSPTEAKPVGDYFLSPLSFEVGQYKDLKINPFNLHLVAESAATTSAAKKAS